MPQHRFREQLQTVLSPRPEVMVAGCSFVPCPMFAAFPSAHQAQVLAIYLIAAEQTREQQAPRRRSHIAEFSVN